MTDEFKQLIANQTRLGPTRIKQLYVLGKHELIVLDADGQIWISMVQFSTDTETGNTTPYLKTFVPLFTCDNP